MDKSRHRAFIICLLFGPPTIFFMIVWVCQFFPVGDLLGIGIGAAAIALLVKCVNRRDDPREADFPDDNDSDDWPEDEPADLRQFRRPV